MIKEPVLILFVSALSFVKQHDQEPVVSKLTVHPCSKSCYGPEAVTLQTFSGNRLSLTFSINRNCNGKDSVYTKISGDTLNVILAEKGGQGPCECAFSYELEIEGLEREPRLIAVNDNLHVKGFGFLTKSSATEDIHFADSLDRLGKYPQNRPFLIEDITFENHKHKLVSWPVDLATYLETKQYLKIELRGNVMSEEKDSTLAYKRAKALREFLVKQRGICTNRVALSSPGSRLYSAPKDNSRSVSAFLSYVEKYEPLPDYK